MEREARRAPILFVHGAWHGAWCWEDHFVPYFANRGWQVTALNLRAHGGPRERRGLRWKRIADYVEDLAAAAAALPEPPVVIGHSMGGLVVQKYLESHPAPAAVLLASVPPKGVLATTLRFLARHPLKFLKTNLTMSLWPIIETPELAREMFFEETMPDSEARGLHSRLQDESYLAYLDMMAFALPRPEAVEKLPMLVLGGGQDRVFTPAEVRATAEAYGAEVEVFPELPHDLMRGPGWQLVAARIESWLASALEVGVHVDVPLAAGAAVGPEVGEVAEGDGAGGGEREPEQDLAVAEVGEHLVDTPVEDGPAGQLQPVRERRKRGEKG
ncbi:MAG: lysophospholipase [Chloroflexi bacterium]|nr:MAG: lysophospholipase [Chloroflexota bacterium]